MFIIQFFSVPFNRHIIYVHIMKAIPHSFEQIVNAFGTFMQMIMCNCLLLPTLSFAHVMLIPMYYTGFYDEKSYPQNIKALVHYISHYMQNG